METFEVHVEKRFAGTKSYIRQLKREGFVPGIIYSAAESMPISLKEDEIRSFLQHQGESQLLTIAFDGKPISTKIKEVQRNPVTQDIQHIDLMPVEPGVLH